MNPTEWTYLVFGIVLIAAIIFDLGLLSKKSKNITIKQALYQTIFWIGLATGFCFFIWYQDGKSKGIEYISAYLMEWSLSIDNIFVFILIFSFFRIKENYYARTLLLGILMAIIFRVIFITIGIALVSNFQWILYIFGALLIFTGFKMFFTKNDDEFDPAENKVYKLIKKIFPLTKEDPEGKYIMHLNGKKYFTMLFVVVIILATTDIVFALDSIPAVFAITQSKLIIYTSNIFAVLGLRSLFFLLRGAVEKFEYLPKGIAIVLVFVGAKMLAEYFHLFLPIWTSLVVIIVCLGGAVIFSLFHKKSLQKNEVSADQKL